MRIFLVVLGLCCLLFLVSFLAVRGSAPVVDDVPRGVSSMVESGDEVPQEVLPEGRVPDGPYEYGYARGRASYLRQMGQNAPMPPAFRYVSFDSHDASEAEARGYADGYHRAGELMFCPRGCTR